MLQVDSAKRTQLHAGNPLYSFKTFLSFTQSQVKRLEKQFPLLHTLFPLQKFSLLSKWNLPHRWLGAWVDFADVSESSRGWSYCWKIWRDQHYQMIKKKKLIYSILFTCISCVCVFLFLTYLLCINKKQTFLLHIHFFSICFHFVGVAFQCMHLHSSNIWIWALYDVTSMFTNQEHLLILSNVH